MSWTEVLMLNSNVREPLNYQNYLTDIASFGKNSYVFALPNESILRDLLVNCKTLYGYSSIHAVLYNRLSANDIDYMIENNYQFGECLNCFYKTTVFTNRHITKVLLSITKSSYMLIEDKLQKGINRYLSSHIIDGSVGEWLTKVFDVDLSAYTTIESLLSDIDCWNTTILKNEALTLCIFLSLSAANWFSQHTKSEIFQSFLETIVTSLDATMLLIDSLYHAGNNALDQCFSNTTFANYFLTTTQAFTALTYHTEGFKSFLKNETVVKNMINTSLCINQIQKSLSDIVRSQGKIESAKTSTNNIKYYLTGITTSIHSHPDLTSLIQMMTDCVSDMDTIITESSNIIQNIPSLFSNETFMNALATNLSAAITIFSKKDAVEVIAKNAKCLWYICRKSVLRQAFVKSPYCHTYYDTMYTTLKSATSLFTHLQTTLIGVANTSGNRYYYFPNIKESSNKYAGSYTAPNESSRHLWIFINYASGNANGYINTVSHIENPDKRIVDINGESTVYSEKVLTVGGIDTFNMNRIGLTDSNYGSTGCGKGGIFVAIE